MLKKGFLVTCNQICECLCPPIVVLSKEVKDAIKKYLYENQFKELENFNQVRVTDTTWEYKDLSGICEEIEVLI